MAKLGAMKGDGSKKGKGGKAAPPPFKKTEVVIEMEDLMDMAGGGYTLGFRGLPNTGKTLTAMALGYLHPKFVDQYKEQYPLTAASVLNGDIPQVDKIVVIESENAIGKQMKRKLERRVFGELFKHTPIRVQRIPIVAQKVYDDLSHGMPITQQSVTEVFNALELYELCLKQASDNYGETTLLILDSASRLYKLINAKAQIVYNRRVQDKGEETVKAEGFNKWGNRNIWWDQDMTLLRGVPGWVIATFQMKESPDWVIESERKKGKFESRYKTVWTKDTPYNLDMTYTFEMDEDNLLEIQTYLGRYMGRGEEEEHLNHAKIDTHWKFSGLQIIENMLQAIEESNDYDD